MKLALALAQAGILAAAAQAGPQAGQVEELSSRLTPAGRASAALAAKATPECSGGIVADDGSFENGYRPVAGATAGALVMRFTPPAGSGLDVDQVCLCWTRSGDGDTAIDHDLVIGTVVFDFSSASGGWVSARYSAFGQFSAEVVSACREAGVRAAWRGVTVGRAQPRTTEP